jgi:hypothetical protein
VGVSSTSFFQYLWDNPDVADNMGREGREYVEKHHTLEWFVISVKTVVEEVIKEKACSEQLEKPTRERQKLPFG